MAEHDLRAAARLAVLQDFRRVGRPRWIRVDGPSMEPLIAPGTWLLVDFGPVKPRVGRVVLAWLGPEFVVHRVVRVRGDRILLQGDAELRADPVVARGDLYGVVRGIRRPDGASTSFGCDGAPGQLIAIASRSAARAHGAMARLPSPIGSLLVRPVDAVARVPVQILALVAIAGQVIAIRTDSRST